MTKAANAIRLKHTMVTVFPKALFIVAIICLLVSLVRDAADITQPRSALAVAVTAAYVLWSLAEARVTFEQSTPPTESSTLIPYGLARAGTAVAATLIGPALWPDWSWWLLLPVGLFLGGIALRLAAIRVLGRFYSHHVLRRADHSVVSTGPYRLMRHPAYAGMLLSHLGLVLVFTNPVSVFFLLALTVTIVWRIRVEERMLWTVSGYPEYALGHARLIPGVW
jgi:protein-S-isoprenylcysteine O-methyltransferase Ste14